MYHGSVRDCQRGRTHADQVVRGMNAMMVYGPTVQPAQQSAFLFCACASLDAN